MRIGATIAVIGEGFLPDQIRNEMRHLAVKTGRKYYYPYNHVEKVIRFKGQLVSIGARAKGVQYTPVEEYLKQHPNHLILNPVLPLTDQEITQMESYANTLLKSKTKYQKGLLLAYILWVRTNIKWFRQGDKKVVCYELVARFDDLISRRGAGDLDMPTVFELIENKHFTNIGEVKKINI